MHKDVHTLVQEISEKIHNLLDNETADLPSDAREDVLDRLGETFRFWR
jgi:hypothetical protein